MGRGYGTRMSVKIMTGEGGGYGTRMLVKSNVGGGNSAKPAVLLQISLLPVFFWYCMEVPNSNLGVIVQSVTPSMPGKLNSTCVLVLLFIFKLLQQLFLSCKVWSIHTRGSYIGRQP